MDLFESVAIHILSNIQNEEKSEIKEKKSKEYLGRKYNILSILNNNSELLCTIQEIYYLIVIQNL